MRNLVLVVALIVSACGGAPVDASKPRATVEKSGSRSGGTDFFDVAGAYRVEWSAQDTTARDCDFAASMSPNVDTITMTGHVGASKSHSDALGVRSVTAGRYSLYVSSDCGSWLVRFVPA